MSPRTHSSSLARLGTICFVLALLALLAAGIGTLLLLIGHDPQAPDCGGQAMSPGDICLGDNGGTFAEMQAQEAKAHQLHLKMRNWGGFSGAALLVLSVALWRFAPTPPPAPSPERISDETTG